MRSSLIGLDGFRLEWSIEGYTLHGPGRMTAVSPQKLFWLTCLPAQLLLIALLCAPLDAYAADARSERASLNLTSLGVEATTRGRLLDAQHLLEEAMVLDPANNHAITELGNVHHARGNAKLARKYYRLALEIDPVAPDALGHLAMLDISEGNRAAAEAALRKLRVICAACAQTQKLSSALGVDGTNMTSPFNALPSNP